MIRADLHLHSSYSDGSDSVKVLAEKIVAEGLKFVALTDHDTVLGCAEIEKYIPTNITYIKGVELTCKSDDLSVHILGYNIDTENKTLLKLIDKGKILRRQKLETRINYLKEYRNIEFTEDELNWLYSRISPVKTHFANLLVKKGLAADNISAMKKYLDNIKTGNTKFNIEEAIAAIIDAGGIPVWAHPLGGEGEPHLEKDEFIQKLNRMISYGIKGLECYYSRYNEQESEFLVECANKNNLYISGGSDYHGNNKDIPIGRLNSDNKLIPSEQLSILRAL